MKFNFIVPGMYRSGGMRVIHEYSKLLTKLGHDVTLYMPGIPFDHYPGEISYRRFLNLYYNYKLSKQNRGIISKYYSTDYKIEIVTSITDRYINDADYVIATSWATAKYVSNLSNSKGKKLYFIQDYEIWNSSLKAVRDSYGYKLHQFTTCEYLKNVLNKELGIDPYIIHYGLDTNKFSVSEKKYTDPVVISFINNSLDKKNTPMALNIVDEIMNKYNNVTIKSFGVFPYTGLQDYINNIVNPTDDEIVDVYSDSHIFLYTSKWEGYGMPPMEAMGCKAVCLSTRVGAIPEFIEDGKTGFLFEIDDEAGMINCISNLIEDRELLKKISISGCDYIQKYQWDSIIKKFLKFIETLK